MNAMLRVILVVLSVVGSAVPVVAQEPSSEPVRTITQLRGDLYMVRDGAQATVFLVTSDGIVLVDPLSRATGLWLRQELAARFPFRPVRYVIHTHHRFDRAGGAGLFDATAQIVGHIAFNRELEKAREADPDSYRDVLTTESSYGSRRTIALGGTIVELVHPDVPHARDLTVVFFPAERVVFAVEPPPVTAPLFDSFTPMAARSWLRRVAPLPFDVLVSGRGETTPAADVEALALYVETLVASVHEGYETGSSLADIQGSPILDAHSGRSYYSDRQAQIAAAYSGLALTTVRVFGAAGANHLGAPPAYCASYATCEPARGLARSGAVGVMLMYGQFGVVAEVRGGDQFQASRTSEPRDDAFAHRDTVASVLFRFSPAPRRRLSFGFVGGPAEIVSDRRGVNFRRDAYPPSGGIHAIAVRESSRGITAGADVVASMGRRLSVVVPVRVTRAWRRPTSPIGATDVHVGVGVALTLVRRVG